MNISATVNVFRLILDPALCLPHATIPTFNHLPIPVAKAFSPSPQQKEPDIKAVVLDKDNCFARPKENAIHKPYYAKFQDLKAAYPGSRLLIVSNSAGTHDDTNDEQASVLEQVTGVKVLRHATKKPGCGTEVLDYFYNARDSGVTRPDQIAVVGDRLFTDVMMANMVGSWGIWIRDGVVKEKSLFTKLELRLATYLVRKGHSPPIPSSQFEE